ncbi:MAG: carcinine hydrolase/isopenicillin-N N-acyltransferase family protein, partial [Candidatus Omnitrophica bacterium]|nr:carcinine hydrolase/isopenicillin-N N-acyltransferase family protein [Candidatus Omnitrophota bacterium]
SISDIGYGFFIKENGFLGINNTGSFLKDEFLNQYGFDDCDIMRIVAESCNEAEESLELIKKMQKEKLIGYTGKKRGMIFLFVDKEKAILVELNSYEFVYKIIEDKLVFTNDFILPDSKKWIKNEETEGTKSSKIRKKRIEEILNENKEINIENLREISRDKKYYPYSICRDTSLMQVRTVSAFISIFSNNPVLYICLGQPYVSPYFPFSILGNKILDKFVTGEVSIKLNKIFEIKQLNDEDLLYRVRNFENQLDKKFEEIKDIEETNLKIQKEVYNFIKEMENESLYNP